MTGGWAIGQGASDFNVYGVSGADTGLTSVTCGTTNTKGSYAQLTSSTTSDTNLVWVFLSGAGATGSALSVDIAVGGAGSEKIIIPDLALQLHSDMEFAFPLQIASASRIAARAQSSTASDVAKVAVITAQDAWHNTISGCDVDCLGFTSATSKGAIADAGTSANTKGAYTQIIASTAVDYSGFLMCCAAPTASAISPSANFLVDLAVGAGGSEQVIVANFVTRNNGSGATQPSATSFLGTPIVTGTRIAARCQCNITTATNRTLLVTVYGLRA